MPSPRSSPAIRPTSPLSPGYKVSSHFDNLQPPQQRPMHSRSNSGKQRRQPATSLKLPSLPRFHPANFPSAYSSMQNTPDGNSHASSPQGPLSPRAVQRMYSDAQKQLYFNQREILTAAARGSPNQAGKPVSPRLLPLGSPGPVTPLELERDEGYLIAGIRGGSNSATPSDEVVEKLIKAEAQRQRATSSQTRQNAR